MAGIVDASIAPPRALVVVMLKHKLKRWLHENEPDGGGVKPEPGSPRMSTPPLPRSPSGSAVNRYPSLKTKLLGPKLEPASPGGSNDSSKENGRVCNGNEGAYTSPFASTQNLAAAASFATGLPCGKRARDYEKFKPASPAKVARVRDEALEADARAESPKPSNRSKPSTPKPAKPRPSPKPKPSGGPASSGGSDGSEPKEETDEEVARRLHQEFNCAPARASRGRGRMGAQEAADDPVHGQDPGILPSC